MLCRQLTLSSDSSQSYNHLLKSKQHVFSKIYISEGKFIIGILHFFLWKMPFEILKTDRDLTQARFAIFYRTKPSEGMIAALEMKNNYIILHVYNREPPFCHLDMQHCCSTQCNASEKMY